MQASKFGAVLFMAVGVAVSAFATPGKLNGAGCHSSEKIGYHCHAEKLPKSSSSESAKEREKRLQRECKGRPNSGICLGYAISK